MSLLVYLAIAYVVLADLNNLGLFAVAAADPALEDVMCYSCVYSYHPSANDSCLTNPEQTQSMRCHHSRFCTITRQWMKAERVVRSFTRGCELRQGRRQSCTEDVHFITCQSFCRTDLCNIGLGDLKSNTRHNGDKSTITPPASPTTMMSRHGTHRVTHPTIRRRFRNNSSRTKYGELTFTINLFVYFMLYVTKTRIV